MGYFVSGRISLVKFIPGVSKRAFRWCRDKNSTISIRFFCGRFGCGKTKNSVFSGGVIISVGMFVHIFSVFKVCMSKKGESL